MKRLVFCFDGTWNKLDAEYPTNVVLTAESVLPLSPMGHAQVIFYDDGVGTAKHEYFTGGIFGAGLVKNIADAYRFLIFNYTPGDEIYACGFSRGAFTARSFVGMLHVSGILMRKYAAKVEDAVALYKARVDTPGYRQKTLSFRRQFSRTAYILDEEKEDFEKDGEATAKLEISYLGVWDTVGGLGVPSRYLIAKLFRKKFQFHDAILTSFVKRARHAVAIDERRKDFVPTLWDNIDDLNNAAGFQSSDPNAPYQQMWFPGVHSSVGGGGERRGLSDQALDWILDGARAAGLVFDTQQGSSRVYELKPDYTEYLNNSAKNSLYYVLSNRIAAADRSPGPQSLYEVSRSAQRRWLEDAKNLRDERRYRPHTLDRVKDELSKLDPQQFGLGQQATGNSAYEMYQVQPGDTLTAIARRKYGSPTFASRIFEANLNKLDSPNRIYQGTMLRLPIISKPSSPPPITPDST